MIHREGHVGNGSGYQPLGIDPNAEICKQAGYECGKLSVGAGANIDCGTCPPGKACDKGKCRSAFQAAVATQFAVSNSGMKTPRPLRAGFSVKPPFYQDQPYLQTLLLTIFDQLASVARIPPEGKTYELIKAWMDEKGFATIGKACEWAGYKEEFLGVVKYCADVGKIGLSYTVTQATCDKKTNELLNKVAEKCSSTYTDDYLTAVEEAKKQQELQEQQRELAEQNAGVPTASEGSSVLPWVLGLGTIAAIGAAVYFAQKPAAPNPSERTSGYKKLEPALVQALKLARKDREEKYVVPRSDGFHILRHQSLPFDKKTGMMKDRESWVVLPNNNYIHWFNGKVADSGPIE